MPGLKPCATHGCPVLVPKGYCAHCQAGRERDRPLFEVRRLYRTARWTRMRASVLREEPVCRTCREHGRVTAASDVDHVQPHRGDLRVFWNRENLQALCRACHSAKTSGGA